MPVLQRLHDRDHHQQLDKGEAFPHVGSSFDECLRHGYFLAPYHYSPNGGGILPPLRKKVRRGPAPPAVQVEWAGTVNLSPDET